MIWYIVASWLLILLAIANFIVFKVLRGWGSFSVRTSFILKILAPVGTILLLISALIVSQLAK